MINIITRRGDHDETTVELNTGSWHRHRYEITNHGNDGRLGRFIVGSLGKSRPYDAKGSNNRTGDYNDKNFALRLDHRFDDRNLQRQSQRVVQLLQRGHQRLFGFEPRRR